MSNDRPDYRGNPLDIIEALTDVAGGLGNWIANGTPDSGSIAGEIQQRYRDHCDAWSNNPSWVQQIDPGARLFLSNACRDWLDSQGSGDPVVSSSPLTGGQCVGARYQVTFDSVITREECGSGETSTVDQRKFEGFGSDEVYGPLTLSGPFPGGNSDCGGPIQNTHRLDYFDQNGNPESVNVSFSVGRTDFKLVSQDLTVTAVRRDGGAECGDPPGVITPNPNPRPDPGLDPEDEPFERAPGQPVFPMPRITNPFGEPVQLPNFPAPPPFGAEDEGPTNPNVGPPITPGAPQDGEGTDGEDDDFGEPPEGHIWVGFIVELSDQGVTEGLQPNSPPQPIYRAITGNYRAIYDIEGEAVYSSPREIRQQTSTYFLDLPGLTLTGARVNVPSNDSYIVTPLSQPVTEEEPQEV